MYATIIVVDSNACYISKTKYSYFPTESLQMYINGIRRYDSQTYCVGDNITFVCTLNNNYHEWSVPRFGVDRLNGIVHSGSRTQMVGSGRRFILRLVEVERNGIKLSITSSISVTGARDLSGSLFLCISFNVDVIQTASLIICK